MATTITTITATQDKTLTGPTTIMAGITAEFATTETTTDLIRTMDTTTDIILVRDSPSGAVVHECFSDSK